MKNEGEKKQENKKKPITDKIKEAAAVYKERLIGRTFMYVFNDEYIEVNFRKSDFAHLTGVDRRISPMDFYKDAVKGTLSPNQIFFSQRYPRDLCIKKLRELVNLPKITDSNIYVLKDITTNTAVYKFGFTELNFTLCVCADTEKDGTKRSDYYVPKSFRVENCFNKAQNVYPIQFIFSKRNDEHFYSRIEFGSREELSELPDEIRDMINEEFLTVLSA